MANGQIRYQIGFDVNKANLDQLKASLQEIQKLNISDVMKINNLDRQAATTTLNKIKQQAQNVETALKQAFNTKLNTINIEQFNQSLIKTHSSITKVYQTFSKAGPTGQAAFRSLSAQVLSTNIQLKESHALLDKMATTLANTVKWNIASGAINAVTRSIQQAWGYAQSLDTSLNDIRIVTGKSADEMAKFAVQANKAAQQLGKTTTDYTNAALIYAQQGLSDEEVQTRARITLKAANVTGQSTDAVSEQLTAVWNGYKVTAEEAELYVDRLAAVAATTASDLEELSTGMSKVASAAAAMGVGEDQLAAQLSTIISVTKQAPESVGTALRTVYARISDIKAGLDEDGVTLGNYSSKMAQLGISVLDMNGNLRDMGEVMEEIGGKWDTLTREQQVYLAQTMAGQRQYNNLLALFDNFEKYNEALNTAQNAAGTLQKQQDIYMESTRAHLNTLKASMEGIYDSLIDTNGINKMIDGLSKVANIAEHFIDSLGGGGSLLKSLGAIGITVFSDQIARGLNTTITNLETGKENARQFNTALQATKQWQGIPGLDKMSQDLLKNREQLLELARVMTPDQFNGMQSLLNDITALGTEIERTKVKLQPLQNSLKNFTTIPLKNVLGDGNQIDSILAKIDQPISGFEKLNQKVLQAKDAFNELAIAAKSAPESTKADEFNKVFDGAQNKIVAFLDKLNELRKTEAFQGLSEKAQGEFDKIDQQWDELSNKLGNMSAEQKTQKFKEFFDRLAQIATSGSGQIKRQYEALIGVLQKPDDVLALEEKQRQLQALIDRFVLGQERMKRAADISNWAKMAGGIAQVGSSLQQLINLGSIWKNEDLTTGQKLLQTITNLAISLPMLINGFTKATTAMGLLTTLSKEQAVMAGISTAAQTSHAFSLGLVERAAGKTAIKLQILNKTLLINPWTALVAVIVAAIGAMSAITKEINEQRKAIIESRQAIIEEENKKQEEIQTNKKLYNSLDQLNQKYKDGQITRSDLKGQVVDLIKQYDLEEDRIKKLTNQYDNLTETIKEFRIESAQAGFQSAKIEATSAKSEVLTAAKGTATDDLQQIGNRYGVTIRDFGLFDESQYIINALQQSGAWITAAGTTWTTDYDIDSIIKLYDDMSAAIEKIEDLNRKGVITDSELAQSHLYKKTKEYLEQMSESVEHYKLAIEDLTKYETELQILEINYTNLLNTKDASQYLIQRQKIIEQITQILIDHNDDPSKAAGMADAYLRNNFTELYTQFNEAANAIEHFRKKFNGLPMDIQTMLAQLDDRQLAALLELDPVITDWNKLKDTIEKISKIDLSNVYQLGDIQASQTTAESDYKTASALLEAVSSGKTVSQETFNSLNSNLQAFFSRMADGTYKMTGDASDFYELVNNLKLDGFKNTLGQIELQQQKVQNLQNANFNYDQLNVWSEELDSAIRGQEPSTNKHWSGGATAVNASMGPVKGLQVINTSMDLSEDFINKQLQYLDIIYQGNEIEQIRLQTWRDEIEAQGISKELALDIAKAVYDANDQTQNLEEKSQQLNEQWRQVAHQMHEAMFPTDEDVDGGALQALSEIIQETADDIDGLSKELSDGSKQAARDSEDVAESILRFDDAILDVVDHYDKWMSALTSGSAQDQAEVMQELRDAYSDLLDLEGSSLSEDFLKNTENLQLMQEAINGNEEAYEELMAAAQQNIATQIGLDTTAFKAQFDEFLSLYFQGRNLDDFEIGARLNNDQFLAALSDMVTAAGMTAQQATDYLASMGIDAEVVEQSVGGEQQSTTIGHQAHFEPVKASFRAPIVQDGSFVMGPDLEYEAQTLQYKPITTTTTAPKETSAFSLKVVSAHKSSGGGFKFKQAKHGGGSGQGTRTTKSGGGGGGGSKSKSTSTKDVKKPIEDTRDIYHDINIEIQQINRNLKRVQQQQDRLYGKQLLDNLNKQSKILDQHKEKLAEKLELQKWDLSQQRQILEGLDVTFDKYGNIANYMDVLGDKQAQVNALIAEENKLIEQYNAETDSDAQKQIGDQITAQEKKVKEAEDEFKELQNKIKSYDSLREAMEDVVDDIEEATQKQIELNIEKFRMELEIRLDMGEAERDWNEFRRNILEHSDVIKDTEFDNIFKDALQNLRDATSYFDVHGSKGSIQTLTEQLIATRNQIQAIDELGKSAIYGDNKAQAMEDLQSDLDELMDQMQDVESLIDDIDNAYLDTIDDVQDQFDKQIEDYEYIGDLIDHDISLLQLLYGDKNYDAMEKYYETLERNNLNQLDSLRQQGDFWKQQWEAAAARGDTQAAKQFEENYKETIQNLNKAIEDSAQTIQNKYINAIDKIFDELDKKISNGAGTDYLSTEWDLMNKNADEYLDTINSAFAIQETERKYQNALNDTKNIKNQQALKKLMDEQLGILRNKEKITQYDIDRAEKLLQVEQARIALEDAQAAKTTLRLKRDSQGNYSYEYMADNAAVGDAESELAQAQNDLYNFDKERYQSNLDDMLAAWKDFQSEYKDIVEDTSLTEQERVERLALLREQYGQYINDKTAENTVIRNNLMQSAFTDLALLYETDVENYNNMSIEEQNILMGELVPAWKSGIQQMSDTVAGEGGFIPTCQDAFDNLTEATLQYEDELNNMASVAGVNLEDVKNGIDNLAQAFEGLIENNDELTSRMQDEMGAVSLLRAQVHALVEEYQAVYDAAKLAATAIHEFIQAQQAEAAAAKGDNPELDNISIGQKTNTPSNAKTNNNNNNNNNNNPGTSTSGGGSGSGGTGGGSGNTGGGSGGSTSNSLNTPKNITNGSAVTPETSGELTPNSPKNGSWVSEGDHQSAAYVTANKNADYITAARYAALIQEYKKRGLLGFATGGYTGSWIDNNGRLALLHQKELVLNEEDTKNILDSVSIMRSVMSNMSGNLAMRLGNIRTGLAQMMDGYNDGIEQNVHIDASFPNVNSKREIEEAFNDLVNLAAQRALRR